MRTGMKRNIWILGPAVFFLFLASSFLLMRAAEAGDAPPAESSEETAPPGMDAAVQMSQQEVRDPFEDKSPAEAPAGRTSETVNAPEVPVVFQGVGIGKKGSYAVINEEVYYAGEEKKGIKMVEVRKGEVDIVVGGASRTVRLFAGEDLRDAQERYQAKADMAVLPKEQTGRSPRHPPVREHSVP